MNLADKIITLRKKAGWSQEELADFLNVSRQAVSKWEGMQSTPDIDKILQLSRLFGVTTDYLLKEEGGSDALGENAQKPPYRLAAEEAEAFLKEKASSAKKSALATLLCILSPIALLLFIGAGEAGLIVARQEVCVAMGLIALILFVAAGVAIFVFNASKRNFSHLEERDFEADKTVISYVKEKREQFQKAYTALNVSGVCLCILSVLPLFISLAYGGKDLFVLGMVCAMIALAGGGVYLLMRAGVKGGSFSTLLRNGTSTKQDRKISRITQAVSTVYWLAVVAAYLIYSFVMQGWNNSWIIWPVAGLIFAALMVIVKNLAAKK